MLYAIFTLNGLSAELDTVCHDTATAKRHCKDLRAMGFESCEVKAVACDNEVQAYRIAELTGEGMSLARAIKKGKAE